MFPSRKIIFVPGMLRICRHCQTWVDRSPDWGHFSCNVRVMSACPGPLGIIARPGHPSSAKTSTMTLQFSTCDFCDTHKEDHSGAFRVLPPVFQNFGGQRSFAGPVVTVRCHEDNTLVKSILEQEGGEGRVLVVDGAGAVQRALMGGSIAVSAARNGWAGVVVFGAVRDIAELSSTPLGIRALALVPMPTARKGQGQRDVALSIQGCWIRPGEWLYADADGMVVSVAALHSIS